MLRRFWAKRGAVIGHRRPCCRCTGVSPKGFPQHPTGHPAKWMSKHEALKARARLAGCRMQEGICKPQESNMAGLDDITELKEWTDAIGSVIAFEGMERADDLLTEVVAAARRSGAKLPFAANTAYINTIPPDEESGHPGPRAIEMRIRAAIRWNAAAIVLKANKESSELGGHIASFQSAALLYDTGFTHFWHGADDPSHGGDLIYVQGHSSPGIYARAFLEGRLSEERLLNFRQETDGKGIPSYPHPWLMPDFWQFPTVSMGLGPLMGIYQARFLKYLP